jgi:hypothetical protein
MVRRLVLMLSVAGLVVGPGLARADDAPSKPPTIVLRIHSLDAVVKDLKYLSNLSGQKEGAQQLDEGIKKVFPKGFDAAGIDGKRPLGLYSSLDPEGNLMDTTAVVLIPISNEKEALAFLEQHQIEAKKEDDGSYAVSLPNAPFPGYFRFAHGYAYVTIRDKGAIEPKKLLDPAKVFPTGHPDVLSLIFRLDQIPDSLKQIAISQLEVRASDADDEKRPGETEGQHAVRVQTTQALVREMIEILNNGTEIALHANVRRQAGELSVSFSAAGKSGSQMAKSIAALGDSQSLFAGLLTPEAPFNGVMHVTVPEEIRKKLEPQIDEAIRKQIAQEKGSAEQKKRMEAFFKTLAPTFKAGELDLGATMRGPDAEKHYNFILGVKVHNGKAIDKQLHRLVAGEKEESKVKMDAATIGDIKVHQINVQTGVDEQTKRTFGDNPLYVCFRDNAFFAVAGPNGLEVLKSALSAEPKAAPPLELNLSMAKLGPVIANSNKSDPEKADKAAAEAFGQEATGKDKLSITLKGGEALQAQLQMNTAVLKFFQMMSPEGSAAKPKPKKKAA